MFELLEGYYQYYYIVLILQGICVFHAVRSGNQQKWIWIIVFLPLIGCIAYVFTEIIQKRHVNDLQTGVTSLVNPGGKIKELEKNYRFSDTFTNRVRLADAYLERGFNEQAIELYQDGLTGTFNDNEHVIKQLILAYYQVGRYEDVVAIAPRVAHDAYFSKSRANLMYAQALEHMGKNDLAEKEYKAMNHRYSNYEARYFYADFLLRLNRSEEAVAVFKEMVNEGQNMSRQEKGAHKVWIDKATQEWGKLA